MIAKDTFPSVEKNLIAKSIDGDDMLVLICCRNEDAWFITPNEYVQCNGFLQLPSNTGCTLQALEDSNEYWFSLSSLSGQIYNTVNSPPLVAKCTGNIRFLVIFM